jgi:hypothetical protein
LSGFDDKVTENVSGLMSGTILLITVIAVVAFGISVAYASVTAVLYAFARQTRQTRPASLRNRVLVPSQTHASGD